MSMNPLGVPKWSHKQPLRLQVQRKWQSVDPGPLPPPPPAQSVYRTRREEAADKAKAAAARVVLEIRGLDTGSSGTHEFAHDPGAPLSYYLGILDLKSIVTKAAMYDLTNPEAGRIKLRYVPAPGARIFIGPPGYSPVAHLQRGVRDAPASSNETVSLVYGPAKTAPAKSREPIDGVDQW